MLITLSEIKKISEILFDKLKENGYDNIEIDKDYYWCIPTEQRYDVYKEPHSFTIGQLTDDWNELTKLLSSDKEAITYGLVWLSTILKAIGEKTIG